MATVESIRVLGYEVADRGDGVWCVSGFGISVNVAVDDQAQIDSLADPILHAARIAPHEVVPVAGKLNPLPKSASLADVIAAVNTLRG